MSRRTAYGVALLVAASVLWGCSRHASSKDALIQRVGEADRVMVLDPHAGSAKTLQGPTLEKIVQALKASQKISAEGLSATPGYTLVFFSPGGAHVGTLPTSSIIFWIDNVPYHDKSGTLESLYLNRELGPGLR